MACAPWRRATSALAQAGHRPPVRLAGRDTGTQLPQAGGRAAAGPRDEDHVTGPRARPRHRFATALDRPEHRHRHHELPRLRHVAADDRAAARHGGLGHAGHHAQRQVALSRPSRHAQRDERPQRHRAHRGQVAQRTHQRLPAHVTGAADGEVDVHTLDHAVDRHDERSAPRNAQHGGVVAQAEPLDSVSQHASDTL